MRAKATIDMKNTTSSLLTTAVLGILSGAGCAGTQPAADHPRSGAEPSGEKHGCGNHEPGKCATVVSKSQAEADQPLSMSLTETIAPGKHVEVNLSFASAVPAKAAFSASGPVGWNVHSHPSGGMVEHQKGENANGTVVFQPPAPGVYSFMWKNVGNTPVSLRVTLTSERGGVTQLQH